jgi:hypothetical protein
MANGGTEVTAGSAGNPTYSDVSRVGAVRTTTSTFPAEIDIAELLVFERLLTTQEDTLVQAYLAGKWPTV